MQRRDLPPPLLLHLLQIWRSRNEFSELMKCNRKCNPSCSELVLSSVSQSLVLSHKTMTRHAARRGVAVAQGRNPQKFVALKMCPIAAAAKMGFPLEVEGHLSCSILVVPPLRRGSAPSRRRRLASHPTAPLLFISRSCCFSSQLYLRG